MTSVNSSDINRKSRIFLVGFMGSGKSTVGAILAVSLGWDFVDLDSEIEQAEGQSIAEIFASKGEYSFRSMETEALNDLRRRNYLVAALGGGAFVNSENREIIQQLGTSIYLECTFETILERCPTDGSRPLLRSPQQAKELFISRQPFYRRSDICIDTSQLSPNDIVSEILERLNVAPRKADSPK